MDSLYPLLAFPDGPFDLWFRDFDRPVAGFIQVNQNAMFSTLAEMEKHLTE